MQVCVNTLIGETITLRLSPVIPSRMSKPKSKIRRASSWPEASDFRGQTIGKMQNSLDNIHTESTLPLTLHLQTASWTLPIATSPGNKLWQDASRAMLTHNPVLPPPPSLLLLQVALPWKKWVKRKGVGEEEGVAEEEGRREGRVMGRKGEGAERIAKQQNTHYTGNGNWNSGWSKKSPKTAQWLSWDPCLHLPQALLY